MFYKKVNLKNYAKFIGKNHEATLFIKNSFHKNCRLSLTILKDTICFFVNFVEFCGCFFLFDCPSSQSNNATFHFGKVEYCWFINNTKNRTSHQMCCIVKVALKNFTKSTGIHLCQSLFWTPASTGRILKIGSVRPSVRPSFCLSVSFLRIGSY